MHYGWSVDVYDRVGEVRSEIMAMHESDSIGGLVKSVLEDTRELMREELELLRTEVREEVSQARAVGVAFSGAAVAGLLGAMLLSVALGSAIAYWFAWPAWTGYAIVAVLLLLGAYLAVNYGRKQLANFRALPKTRATVKENLAWIQSKSAQR
jgi:hypothetical protein